MNDTPFIDAHTHVNFAAFDSDRDEVMKRTLEGGVFTIQVGTQKDTSLSAIELSEKYEEGVYAAIGVHPIHTDKSFHDEKELGEGGKEFTSRGESFDYEYYKKLALREKTVAIGECGLDYFRLDPSSLEKQEKSFLDHIRLANDVKKPLMLHIRSSKERSAYLDACEILKREANVRGNVHFFAGSIEEARKFLDLGYTISFTGVITFAKEYVDLVRFVPIDSILSETDSPYVSPVPYRGKRNEPVYVKEVVKKIAEIKAVSIEEAKEKIFENAKKLFTI